MQESKHCAFSRDFVSLNTYFFSAIAGPHRMSMEIVSFVFICLFWSLITNPNLNDMKTKTNLGILFLFIILISGCGNKSVPKAENESPGTLKVLSYNVYWGMKEDTTADKRLFSEWIKKQNPDILALQEMNGFSQENSEFIPKEKAVKKYIQRFAESYGHPYAYIVREPAPDGSVSFPVAITSKYPIVNVRRVLENSIHGFLEAEIKGYHFIITHFHPFSAKKRSYELEQILATMAAKPADSKWFLIGDLNSVSPLDKKEYDNHLLRDFIRADREKRPHNKNLGDDDELDYSIQQKILDAGFVDAFKLFHPDFVASAPTRMAYDQSKHPLRYDYIYVSPNIKAEVKSCDLIKDEFTDIYSDHYPVVLTLNAK